PDTDPSTSGAGVDGAKDAALGLLIPPSSMRIFRSADRAMLFFRAGDARPSFSASNYPRPRIARHRATPIGFATSNRFTERRPK
ncbi:MAG: hypothetical protein KGL75_07950, partial [Acidobacteriota bacterium]|nr:hypothetical protein [Acidobacteriota bacterium]